MLCPISRNKVYAIDLKLNSKILWCHDNPWHYLHWEIPRISLSGNPSQKYLGTLELYHASPIPSNQCCRVSGFSFEKGKSHLIISIESGGKGRTCFVSQVLSGIVGENEILVIPSDKLHRTWWNFITAATSGKRRRLGWTTDAQTT